MKVIVAGGRDFTNYKKMTKKLNKYFRDDDNPMIIHGGATGADDLADEYARHHDIDLVTFPANWGGRGKSAGFVRNVEMAKFADELVAFWDGESPGTRHMIDTALKYNVIVTVIRY